MQYIQSLIRLINFNFDNFDCCNVVENVLDSKINDKIKKVN